MCKLGISVSVKEKGVEEKGRISYIRINKKTNNIVGDFKGNHQKNLRIVDIQYVEGINKKSNKKLIDEIKNLEKKLFTPKFNPTVVG